MLLHCEDNEWFEIFSLFSWQNTILALNGFTQLLAQEKFLMTGILNVVFNIPNDD